MQNFTGENGSSDIFAIGRAIQQHVDEHWAHIFEESCGEMVALYPEMGDGVYGMYGARLFKAVHETLKNVGLRAIPRLPGNFGISREWGNDERDRQRWFWSKIITADRAPVGTIVCVFYHDHIDIRIPRAFRIIALQETTKGDVVRALSALSPEFANAQEE